MKNQLSKISNTCVYFLSTMKNRYPCRILEIYLNNEKKYCARFKAGGKFSSIDMEICELTKDSALIEKFHPLESMQLGFLSTYNLLFSDSQENVSQDYKKILNNIMENYEQ